MELFSRHGANRTDVYPSVVAALKSLRVTSCVLDGELVALDIEGCPSRDLLQRRQGALVYYAFDLLELNGKPLLREPWQKRRNQLEKIFDRDHELAVQLVDVYEDGVGLLKDVYKSRLEGIVAKRINGKYMEGKTSDSWRKIKIPYNAE